MARVVIEIAIKLLVKTLVKRLEKFTIFPLFILPLRSDTIIHMAARPMKKRECDGKYDLRLAGFVHTNARNDIVRMMISASKVKDLNLRLSIFE
jgi:hypothetical protein